MPELSQQRVVITGAGQGLGAAIARHFAAQGATLVLLDVNEAGLAEVNSQIGETAQCIAVDLTDADATEDAIMAMDGPVDTVIHNAAILQPEPLDDVSLGTFQATLNVGVQAAFQLSKAVWPHMKDMGGALIFVSSQSGIKGFVDETAYCAAKHALEGFSKCLAMEGEDHGIISCTVTPGMLMRTPMSERVYTSELKKKWVEPDRLAPAFAYIASTRKKSLSGQRLNAWELSQEHPS
jgi:NAD(P)-dependent dehydrogenase (short-subunit alcohol dehydrogenase family)